MHFPARPGRFILAADVSNAFSHITRTSTEFENFMDINLASIQSPKGCGSGGIRTHAPEETGALNQRLRPLGHATEYTLQGKKKALASE